MNKNNLELFSKMVKSNFVKNGVRFCHDIRFIEALKDANGPISPEGLAKMMKFKEPLVKIWLRFLLDVHVVRLHENNMFILNEGLETYIEELRKIPYVASLEKPIALQPSILRVDGEEGFTDLESVGVWQKFSNDFEFMNADLAKAVVKLIKQHRPEAKVILDGGCGTGGFSTALARELGMVDIYACDFMEENIYVCKEKIVKEDKKIIFDVKDLESLDYGPKQFDVVILMQVLHDLVDIPKVLQQVQKVLKDGGIVISIDPEVYSDPLMNIGNISCAEAELIGTLICKPSSGCRCHGVDGGVDGIVKYVKANGFEILEGPMNILGKTKRFHSALVFCKDMKKLHLI